MRRQTNPPKTPKSRAFTLIELLIVIAIVLILIAIAMPNFMKARMRAKVTAVTADMRSAAQALEAYCMDNNCPETPGMGSQLDFSTTFPHKFKG